MNENAADLKNYLEVLRRRRRQILVSVVIIFGLAAVLAFTLPPAYRSTATILIESQDIPPDLVRSTVTSYASERIELISRQVMIQPNLQQIIEKYDVYPSLREQGNMPEAVQRLRENIDLELVSANVVDPKTGRSAQATIAFTLSYQGETPEVAQQVANELASLFLSENIKLRTQLATATSEFLAGEAERLRQQITHLEAQIAAFKGKHVNQLPELAELNMQMLNRAETELIAVENAIQALEETRINLDGQLAQTNPSTPIISVTGDRILDTAERLRALQAQYTALSGVYSPDHPDVVKMRREIAALQKDTGGGLNIEEIGEQVKQLTAMRGELAAMREKYSKDHPDVVKLEKSIAALEQGLRKRPAPTRRIAVKPENPTYITLHTRLGEAQNELRAMRARRDELRAKIEDYEQRLLSTPQVEQEYRPLVREYENAVRHYDEIKTKQVQAQIAQQLEASQKGERFSVIEPPQLPTSAEEPSRPTILLIGWVLALMGGLGYAAVAEAGDRSIHGERGLAAVTGELPLVSVPYIMTKQDIAHRRRARMATAALSIVGLLLLLWVAQITQGPLHASWWFQDVPASNPPSSTSR